MNSEAVFSAAFFSSELALLPLTKIERKEVNFFKSSAYPEKKLSQVLLPFATVEGSAFQLDDAK